MNKQVEDAAAITPSVKTLGKRKATKISGSSPGDQESDQKSLLAETLARLLGERLLNPYRRTCPRL